MNQYFLELKLNDQPLEKFYQYPDHLSKSNKLSSTYTAVHKGFIVGEIVQSVQSVGLDIDSAVIFKKRPGQASPLHVDILEENSKFIRWHCAINWNLNFSKSYMAWYDTAEEECLPKDFSERKIYSQYPLTGIHYGYYGNVEMDLTKTKLLEKTEIYRPTLVRTDIPHQIVNQDIKDRWCLSVRFKGNPLWDIVYESFKLLSYND
jgi:hypothetical protein